MIDDQDKSSARPAIILLLVVFLVAGFSVKYGLQTLTWIEGKLWNSDNPRLANGPPPPAQSQAPLEPLAPLPAAAKPGKAVPPPQLKASNYEFKSPWPGNPTAK